VGAWRAAGCAGRARTDARRQVPALGIFEKSLEMGKFDKSRALSDGSLLSFKKIYPLDAVFDVPEDVPEDIKARSRRSRARGRAPSHAPAEQQALRGQQRVHGERGCGGCGSRLWDD